jgi:hypothetical protein
MSQQAAARQGAPVAERAGRAGQFFRGQGDPPTKGSKSAISKIANKTFNMRAEQICCAVHPIKKKCGELCTTHGGR